MFAKGNSQGHEQPCFALIGLYVFLTALIHYYLLIKDWFEGDKIFCFK